MSNLLDSSYQEKTRIIVTKLIDLYNLQSEKDQILELFNSLTKECLSYPITEEMPEFSRICVDGTPLQFSAALMETQLDNYPLRYVTEICKPAMKLGRRIKITRRRIPLLLELIKATHLQPSLSKIFDSFFPSSKITKNSSQIGIWIGVQHRKNNSPELKFYCNLQWNFTDPWSLINETLDLLHQSDLNKEIGVLKDALGIYCHPIALGIACNTEGFDKVKLYLRGSHLSQSRVRDFLNTLGWNGFNSVFNEFHDAFLEGLESYYPHSVVVCLGLSGQQNDLYDFKVEIGTHRYLKQDNDVYQKIIKFGEEISLDTRPYLHLINAVSNGNLSSQGLFYHDIIGVGYNPHFGSRMNIYIKPNLSQYCLDSG
jgi:hypothetical protein